MELIAILTSKARGILHLMNTLWRELWHSFLRIHGTTIAFISLLISLLPLVWADFAKIAIGINLVLPIGMLMLLLCASCFDLALRAQATSSSKPPIAKKIFDTTDSPLPTMLYSASELFGQGMLVSVYRNEESVEILVGIGFVSNVQNNKMFQVKLAKSQLSAAEWQQVIGDKSSWKSFMAKPSGQFADLSTLGALQ